MTWVYEFPVSSVTVGTDPPELCTATKMQFPLPVGKVKRIAYVLTKWVCVLEWLTCCTRVGAPEGGGVAVTVMAALPDLVVSAAEVAVNETAAGLGTAVGAVYVTEVAATLESVPQVAPEQPEPERLHVTF
jgi:hypothetical protein